MLTQSQRHLSMQMQVYMANNAPQELEKCPKCLEQNEHYTNHGICDCEVQEIWTDDETKLSLEDYTTLFFQML